MSLLSKFVIGTAPLAMIGCASAPVVPPPPGVRLVANMTGPAEVPPGDPDGTGTATMTVDSAAGQLCYTLAVAGIAPAMAAHVHKGAAGTDGPPVVPLTAPANGSSQGCAPISSDVAADMIAHPADYYVNVHNADYPGGAVRGQLGL